MPNTVQVQVQCAHPRSHTHVQWRHRSGYTCHHCASSSTAYTPTSTHPRTIGGSLRPPMPTTVQVHVQGACPRTRTHVQYVHRSGGPCQTLYTYTYGAHVPHRSRAMGRPHSYTQWVYFCMESTPLGPYMPKAVHAHTHILTTMGTRLGLHLPTAVHAHINAHTSKGAPLGLHLPNAVPYAHPRKIRLTSPIINFYRTLRPGK